MFRWKNFENRSIFGEDMDKSMWLSFFGPPCIYVMNVCVCIEYSFFPAIGGFRWYGIGQSSIQKNIYTAVVLRGWDVSVYVSVSVCVYLRVSICVCLSSENEVETCCSVLTKLLDAVDSTALLSNFHADLLVGMDSQSDTVQRLCLTQVLTHSLTHSLTHWLTAPLYWQLRLFNILNEVGRRITGICLQSASSLHVVTTSGTLGQLSLSLATSLNWHCWKLFVWMNVSFRCVHLNGPTLSSN